MHNFSTAKNVHIFSFKFIETNIVVGNNLELRIVLNIKIRHYWNSNPGPLKLKSTALPLSFRDSHFNISCCGKLNFLVQKLEMGVKMTEFSDGLSKSGCPNTQSMLQMLIVYCYTNGLSAFHVFIQFQNRHGLSLVFWGK
jgi:hypothetical protein